MLCVSGSHVTGDRLLGRLWDLEVRSGQNLSNEVGCTLTVQKQAEYLDIFHYFVRRRLVWMAWHS
jgi:hypothetical protein